MKNILKAEDLAMTVFAIYLLNQLDMGWSLWIWVLLFFSPDISMLGYLISNKVGAICYNLFHHKAIALMVYGIGIFLGSKLLMVIGLLLFAHSCFDRIWGYGLKYFSGFKHTHLGDL